MTQGTEFLLCRHKGCDYNCMLRKIMALWNTITAFIHIRQWFCVTEGFMWSPSSKRQGFEMLYGGFHLVQGTKSDPMNVLDFADQGGSAADPAWSQRGASFPAFFWGPPVIFSGGSPYWQIASEKGPWLRKPFSRPVWQGAEVICRL